MKRVHFVGIGGAGLSALAQVMLARDWQVSGSDRERSARTDMLVKQGARFFLGHQEEAVQGADVVVVSSAIAPDNPERLAAERLGIPVLKREQWLAELTREFDLVAVAGTHGKTTTSAMVALLLVAAGRDPTVVVGGEVAQLGGNARAGDSNLFVIEADEYDYAFLGLHPAIGVVLNVEHDHPDIFVDEAAIQQAFRRFLAQVRPGGAIIACQDDPGVRAVLGSLDGDASVSRYGLQPGADWVARDLRVNTEGGTDFVAEHHGEPFGAFRLHVPGKHNVLNALAAIAVGAQLGVEKQVLQEALARFHGVARRFERVGEVGAVQVWDDYAHHPTEIRATLEAARARFGGCPLWVVFQPHTFSRLAALRENFVPAFRAADHLVVSAVYAAREQGDAVAEGRALAKAITAPQTIFQPSQEDIIRYLVDHLPTEAVVLTLGAGDITHLGPRLVEALEVRAATSRVRSEGVPG